MRIMLGYKIKLEEKKNYLFKFLNTIKNNKIKYIWHNNFYNKFFSNKNLLIRNMQSHDMHCCSEFNEKLKFATEGSENVTAETE